MLIPNSRGNYSFLQGGRAYSAGVVAASGFAIEHVRFRSPLPWRAGFDGIDAHLRAAGRPRAALCAVALRSPAPLSFDGFRDFNAGYAELLQSWDLFVDGVNPIARTNVAPEVDPPSEPSLYSFAYTAPSASAARSFVVAGAGEIPDGTADPRDIVRAGDTSPDAMDQKARFVLGLVEQRLHALGADWPDAAVTNVYTVHDLNRLLHSAVLSRIGRAVLHGVTWYYSRPPILDIEFEMDARGGTRDTVA